MIGNAPSSSKPVVDTEVDEDDIFRLPIARRVFPRSPPFAQTRGRHPFAQIQRAVGEHPVLVFRDHI